MDERAPAEWTEAEGLAHLRVTFQMAVKSHPDIMEPYLVALDGGDEKSILRRGLRETFQRRFPA